MKKIAFCFLIIDRIHHEDLWFRYLSNVDKRKYTIYIHYKTEKRLKHFENYKLKECIETAWGEISLVHAQNLLLEEALKDPENAHFIFVSGTCIPLSHFDYTYAYLKPKYSYFSNCPQEDCFPRSQHALSYIDKKYIHKSYQWCILNRKHAKIMVEDKDYLEWFKVCPDEHSYITKLHVLSLEQELVLTLNTKNVETTFTNWEGGYSSPKTYESISEEELNTLLKKKHLFGRKFNKECDFSKLYYKSPFDTFLIGTILLFLIILLSVLFVFFILYKVKTPVNLKLTNP